MYTFDSYVMRLACVDVMLSRAVAGYNIGQSGVAAR